MSRARNIKPSFFTNDTLAECEPLARLLFVGLWTIADREGRLEDRPKKIKAETLPYDNCDPEILLQQLSEHSFILRYASGENKFIQILNFTKHQNPHVKEAASIIPAPDKNNASLVQNVPLTDSPILIPESSSLRSESCARKNLPERFLEFWEIFPNQRKGNRQKAEAAYRQALSRDTANAILTGLKSYADSDEVLRGFAKGAAAWLNDDRWKNDYSIQPKGNSNETHLGNIQPTKSKWATAAEQYITKHAQPAG